MDAPEAIMICIDSSQWMNCLDRFYWYTLQLNCVRSYCVAKFKSNPKNAIGILKMGTRSERQKSIRPTSDLDQILDFLENNRVSGGGLSFFCGLQNCWYILQQLYPRNQKRILMFTGGPADYFTMVGAGTYGNKLKEMGIAVDVVNFCVKGVKAGDWKGREWMRGLDKFVEAVNNNNNSCIKHIKANSLTRPCHILSSDPEIISRDLLEEAGREINKDLKGKNHVESVFKIPQVLKFDDVYDHYSLELDNRCKALSSLDNNDKKKVKLGKRKMVARNSYVASRRRTKACLMILSKKHRFWYRSIT